MNILGWIFVFLLVFVGGFAGGFLLATANLIALMIRKGFTEEEISRLKQ